MIQWFPGHMAKALKQLKEKQTLADLFIVVLDSRAPISSYNTEFDDIAPAKPRLFVITKKDFGDEKKLSSIINHYKKDGDDCILVNLKSNSSGKKIIKKAERMLEKKHERDLKKGILKPRLRVFVVGVPNSGKSTLINAIAKKSSTKVGNMPGVTKGQQWVSAGNMQLLDTPGILWPKFDDELIGIKLAIIGSIKTDIIPTQELVYSGYKLLSKFYPEKLHSLNLKPANNEKEIYKQILILCKEKKFIMSKEKPDFNKVNKWFINYLKNLKLVTYD
ncbi:MAG: ribosome biogenesis GTPase YlqF [Mycoplasma sp.]|nr:ribosome biogenesis GTPase YlqF [Mycoplasma sp.]